MVESCMCLLTRVAISTKAVLRAGFFKVTYPICPYFSRVYEWVCTDKKKIKYSSYIRIFRVEQLQSHIQYMRKGFLIYEEMRKYFPIYEEAVCHTYMTLQLLHSEFPYIRGNFYFLFYQCASLPWEHAKWWDGRNRECDCREYKMLDWVRGKIHTFA